MNIFYAPPSQIQDDVIELRDQEAIHASKALRYQQGDEITVVDGTGGWYEGEVQLTAKRSLRIVIRDKNKSSQLQTNGILGIAIIKKKDRLEFAVEKAVELGVKAIALFSGERSVKQNVRLDRLESIALAAMKQSLRSWLPKVHVFNNLQVLNERMAPNNIIVAHETRKEEMNDSYPESDGDTLLLVGPEGGFSNSEIDYLQKQSAGLVSLGPRRLRTETASLVLLNQFNYLNRR